MVEADARARVAVQARREERLAKADIIVDNSGGLEALEAQVDGGVGLSSARCPHQASPSGGSVAPRSVASSGAAVPGRLRLRARRRPARGHRGARPRASSAATGSRRCSASPARGKSATIAWTIEQVQRPTLVLAPNKSLAAQLANEFREFFPKNRVEYFVSLLRLLPARGVPPVERHLHREGLVDQRRDRPAAPLGHRARCSPGATSSSWRRCRASTASARPRSTSASSSILQRGRGARPARDPAHGSSTCSTSATT